MTFVNMERIEKRFNNQTVLRDVSLKMNRGEIVSIIGPSGSGKSTFLRWWFYYCRWYSSC